MRRKLCNVLLSVVLASALLTGCGNASASSADGAESLEGSQDSGEPGSLTVE